MNTRRTFLKTGAAATAGLFCANPLSSFAAEGRARLKNFGFIAGIAGEAMKADWKGTLKKAAEFGFTEYEGGSNYASSPQEFLNYCKQVGIKPILSGIDFKKTGDELQAEFAKINALNMKYAV
ncbi:MAG: twin-arginine translocation signal domain-containing protein, partial [Mariniphaga sp.]